MIMLAAGVGFFVSPSDVQAKTSPATILYASGSTGDYEISVIAQTPDGVLIADTTNLIINKGAPTHVSVGDTFSGITLDSTNNDQYRLIRPAYQNYKILADPFSTNHNGEIVIQITQTFVDTYSVDNKIEIIAIFVELIPLEVKIDGPVLGSVIVRFNDTFLQDQFTVRDEEFTERFGKGTKVTISFIMPSSVRVDNISCNPIGWIMDPGDTASDFVLNGQMSIIVKFIADNYILDVAVVEVIDNDKQYSSKLPSVEAEVERENIVIPGKEFVLGDNLTIRTENKNNWKDDWKFVGWVIVIDGGDDEVTGDWDLLNSIYYASLEITEEFIGKHLSTSTTLKIEAHFAKIFTISFYKPIGGIVKDIIGVDMDEEELFDLYGLATIGPGAGQSLTLVLEPLEHFKFSTIKGITIDKAEELEGDIIITFRVTEGNNIDILFDPIKRDVESTLQGKGKIIPPDPVGIGERLTIRYSPSFGSQWKTWMLNGISVDELNNAGLGNLNTSIGRYTVTFTVTEELLKSDWFVGDTIRLDSEITNEINTFLLIGLIAIAVIAPALLIGIICIIIANKKQKADYALALEKMRIARQRLETPDLIRRLKEEA